MTCQSLADVNESSEAICCFWLTWTNQSFVTSLVNVSLLADVDESSCATCHADMSIFANVDELDGDTCATTWNRLLTWSNWEQPHV